MASRSMPMSTAAADILLLGDGVRPPRLPGDRDVSSEKSMPARTGCLSLCRALLTWLSGSVYLRLVPFRLSRLHPPGLRGDFVPCKGDASSPYQLPLRRGASPVDVTQRGGMSPSQVSAGVIFESAGRQWSRSWWRWIAYARTPFGWAMFPTPQTCLHLRRGGALTPASERAPRSRHPPSRHADARRSFATNGDPRCGTASTNSSVRTRSRRATRVSRAVRGSSS